jgi:transcriptional regulator with XRE-family HTH domain
VAEKMGISYSALCKYEAGIRMPTDEQKKKIAEFYGVSEEEIFFA